MKKVNLVKIIHTEKGLRLNPIFILTNVDYSIALTELSLQHDLEKCDAFQDVNEINFDDELPFFVVFKNKCSITYMIEESIESIVANTFRVLKYSVNNKKYCLN